MSWTFSSRFTIGARGPRVPGRRTASCSAARSRRTRRRSARSRRPTRSTSADRRCRSGMIVTPIKHINFGISGRYGFSMHVHQGDSTTLGDAKVPNRLSVSARVRRHSRHDPGGALWHGAVERHARARQRRTHRVRRDRVRRRGSRPAVPRSSQSQMAMRLGYPLAGAAVRHRNCSRCTRPRSTAASASRCRRGHAALDHRHRARDAKRERRPLGERLDPEHRDRDQAVLSTRFSLGRSGATDGRRSPGLCR